MSDLPALKRRKTQGKPFKSDSKSIKFVEPYKVFIDIFEFIDELKSFLTKNVGRPIKLLIVFYALLGCSNDDTYLKLGDMLGEIGINSEVFDGDDGDNEMMKEFYDNSPTNATVILDTRGLSIEETREYQETADKCGANMQFVFYDKPQFVYGDKSDIRNKLAEYPDNPNCVAILNEPEHLMDFAICVRENTQLDFVYVAKIFTTYLYKKEDIFQVPSLKHLEH